MRRAITIFSAESSSALYKSTTGVIDSKFWNSYRQHQYLTKPNTDMNIKANLRLKRRISCDSNCWSSNTSFTHTRPFPLQKLTEEMEKLQFRVRRNRNNNFGIYIKQKSNGIFYTQIRNIDGNILQLRDMIESHCNAQTRIRTGSIEVSGNRQWEIVEWLSNLGF